MVAASELPIDTGASALEMAEAIFGDGVSVVGASYTGDSRSSGIYTDGDSIAPGATPSDEGVILSTGRVTDFTNSWGQSNQDNNTSSNMRYGVDNDTAFNAIAGTRTYDASWLDVDFIPTGDVMTMQFVFSSDEYPEYSGSIYNDVVGVWINGVHVPLSVGDGLTSVGNVNQTENENLYVDNTSDDYNTEMDGFTVTMTLTIPVIAGEVNSIRIGIADVSDSSYDSSLLIAGDSVQTTIVAHDDVETVYVGGTKTIDVLANDDNHTSGSLVITHINGVAVVAGDTVALATGQQITLNADGTIDVLADSDEEQISFTYGIESSAGGTDTGFVIVDSIPCFTTGTRIATPEGERAIETLEPGDLVLTHDNGAVPLRWIGRRRVAAVGKFAPIHFAAGAMGADQTRDLLVSPQHRMLVCDGLAELLFGDAEVLIKAKDLVNGSSVRRLEGGEVEYVHILFDRHEVVFAEGALSESFLPGPQMTQQFEQEIVDEIEALFPEFNAAAGDPFAPPARPPLRGFEARALLGDGVAA